MFSGRWHLAGRPVIYTAEHPAQAILEVRVHLDLPYELLPEDYVLVAIDLGTLTDHAERLTTLPPDPQGFGSIWLAQTRSAVLAVPSVVAPRGWNYLLNPAHPEAATAKIATLEDFKFDPRLWTGP